MRFALVALAGTIFAAAAAWPAAVQDDPSAREARGSIRQMQRLSSEEAWVLTDTAVLFTRDGGMTWSDVASGQWLEDVTDSCFLSASRGWLAGVSSASPELLVVFDTADGGVSWRERVVEASALASGQVYARARVNFLDAAHGWVLGQVATSSAFSIGNLLRTTDGGATWECLPRPPAAGRFVFVDSEHGYLTGAPVSECLYRNAWTERVGDHSYLAGAYGNARNVQNDWIPGNIANPPDAVWLTPWVCGRTSSCDWTPTVFGVPGLDDEYWAGDGSAVAQLSWRQISNVLRARPDSRVMPVGWVAPNAKGGTHETEAAVEPPSQCNNAKGGTHA